MPDDTGSCASRYIFTGVVMPARVGAPILHEARPGEIQVVLRRDRHAERLHARQMIGPADEGVLDRPAAIDDRSFRVRLLVGVEHQIDRGIADRVRRDAPVLPVQLADRGDVTLGVDGLQAAKRAVLVPRLLVEIAHQAALEAAVDGELDAADAQPLVALVLLDARRRRARGSTPLAPIAGRSSALMRIVSWPRFCISCSIRYSAIEMPGWRIAVRPASFSFL